MFVCTQSGTMVGLITSAAEAINALGMGGGLEMTGGKVRSAEHPTASIKDMRRVGFTSCVVFRVRLGGIRFCVLYPKKSSL